MNFDNLINLQLVMALIAVFGFVLRKKNIIFTNDKRVVTDIVVNIVLPCNIIDAFFVEFSKEILIQGGLIMLISCLIEVFCVILNRFLYNKVPKEQRMIYQYGTICSNAGFLGTPVAEGIYGAMGMLYASLYVIPQRVVMWSAGVSYFSKIENKREVVKKVATHPCIVAVYIGLFVLISQIQLPYAITRTISATGDAAFPLAMLLIGFMLAESNFKTMFTKGTVLFSFLRLIIIPFFVFIACKFTGVPELVGSVSVVLAAMPAGTSTAILAIKYNGDGELAAKCIVLTTILSLFFIPFWAILLSCIY
ncbi:MAG: AEC family transporter [Clostridia bacterium]